MYKVDIYKLQNIWEISKQNLSNQNIIILNESVSLVKSNFCIFI